MGGTCPPSPSRLASLAAFRPPWSLVVLLKAHARDRAGCSHSTCRGGGPRPSARHGLPLYAAGDTPAAAGLGPLVGELGRRYASGGGVAISQQDVRTRPKRSSPLPTHSAGALDRGGIEGERSTPRQPLPGTREAWPQGVCWLDHRSVAQASGQRRLDGGPDPMARRRPRRALPPRTCQSPGPSDCGSDSTA